MVWYYGIRSSDKKAQVFETDALPKMKYLMKPRIVNSIEYQCVHGGKECNWTKEEAAAHSKKHGEPLATEAI